MSPRDAETVPVPRRALGQLRMLVVDNLPIIVGGVVLAASARIAAHQLGIVDDRLPGWVSVRDGWSGSWRIVLTLAAGILYFRFVVNPIRRRLRASKGESRSFRPLRAPLVRLASIPLVYIFLGLFMDGFILFKRAIPFFHPFRWDPALHALDKAVHLGVEPWRITHALLPGPWPAAFLDWSYTSWIPLGAIMVTIAAWSVERTWRARFFFSYMATWVLVGILAATALSSVGPCFYGRLLPTDPYAPLMDRLRDLDASVPLASLALQDGLWTAYIETPQGLVKGISAMPSVHVALAVVFAFAVGSRVRWLGWVLAVYAGLVLLATIHLGWHYAIDGYLAALLGWGIWWGSAPVARAYFRRTGDLVAQDRSSPDQVTGRPLRSESVPTGRRPAGP